MFSCRKRIHWRRFVTRKVIFIGVSVITFRVIEHFFHFRLASWAAEFTTSAFAEHLAFGVPFEEAA